MFVRVDVAAAERGFAFGDFDHVKHSIAVEEMVGTVGDELRVWAVADVRAVKAAREGALHHLARGGGKLLHRT